MRKIKADGQVRDRIRAEAQQYALIKRDERGLEERRKEIGKRLLDDLREVGQKSVSCDVDDETRAVVRIKNREKQVIDEEKLKKQLGAKAFNKLTRRVLDEEKLEAAITLGEVDPNVVAACTEFIDTPYLEARLKHKEG